MINRITYHIFIYKTMAALEGAIFLLLDAYFHVSNSFLLALTLMNRQYSNFIYTGPIEDLVNISISIRISISINV